MKLPHIPQLFTARIFSLSWKAFFTFIWLTLLVHNVNTRSMVSPISPFILTVLSEPFDSLAHVPLARKFWVSGAQKEAIRELALSDHSSAPAVLGAQAQKVLISWENEPNTAAMELTFWETVIAKHPNYPDGYLGAAVASIRNKMTDQAKSFTTSLLSLDPNNTTGLRLKNLLE